MHRFKTDRRTLIDQKIQLGYIPTLGRPKQNPTEIKERFMHFLTSKK